MESQTVCAVCGEISTGRPIDCGRCGRDPRVEGRYRLEAELGRGGGGVTWRARREPGGDPICLKELRWATMPELDAERRFAREGALLSQLSHPAIPKHHGAFSWGEGRQHALYIAQELVVGENLEQERRSRGYTEREVVDLGLEVADVLVYLHNRNPPMVHRDMKPSNLMRRVDGRIVVVDFGAARLVGLGDSQVSVAGTFGFMAPEQIRGEAGPSADIYGLGMTLAVMLSGGPPEALLDERNRPSLSRLGHRGGSISEAFRALLTAMLELSPESRPTASEVVKRLQEIKAGRAHQRVPVEPMSQDQVRPEVLDAQVRTRKQVRNITVGGASLLVLIMIGGTAVREMTKVTTWVAPSEVMSDSVLDYPIDYSNLVPVGSLDQLIKRSPGMKSDELIASFPDVDKEPPPPPLTAEERRAQDLKRLAPLCEKGDDSACSMMVNLSHSATKEMVDAIAWPKPFENSCNAGHAEACLSLAKVYSGGYKVEASRIETRKWFEQACNHGSVEGCESVGHMMLKGDGGKPDPKAALVPLQKACDGGDKEACLSVGAIYAEGMGGVKTDRPKALGIFESLCDDGHRIGCDNLDAMIGNDWGLPPGAARVETLGRLCDKRSGVSCHRLGLATASGSGTKKDAVRAKELFTRGCDLGFKESCKRL